MRDDQKRSFEGFENAALIVEPKDEVELEELTETNDTDLDSDAPQEDQNNISQDKKTLNHDPSQSNLAGANQDPNKSDDDSNNKEQS